MSIKTKINDEKTKRDYGATSIAHVRKTKEQQMLGGLSRFELIKNTFIYFSTTLYS
jgi:hypothetical protein